MQELMRYSNTSNEDPLVQMALLFAQFLIIHPFMDGNGRVARILIPHFLFQKGILPAPTLFLSPYLRRHRVPYFQILFRITDTNSWEEWIQFFFKAINHSLTQDLKTLSALFSLHEKLPQLPTELFQNPFFTKNTFQRAGGSSQLLQSLIKGGFVKKEKKRGYVLVPLFRILEKAVKN